MEYEKGDMMPSCETLLWYADYFNVSLDYIFGRTDNPQGEIFSSFVNAIYLYDDYATLICNYKDGTQTITYNEIKGSDFNSLTPPNATPDEHPLRKARNGCLYLELYI